MSAIPNPTMQQHRRAGKPKSRKGCITCKIRHVKCGEEKPECKQCTRSGRKCDGYSDASQRELHAGISRSSPPQIPWNAGSDNRLVLIPGTRQERQYVHFFCAEATNVLSGFFHSDFWNRILPQMSHQNATIRHAAAAVGAAYEQYTLRASEENITEGFALQQYNKAIHHFRNQVPSPQGSNYEAILITCALFSCLEMLRDNHHGAMDHVQGGVQILLSRLRSTASHPSTSMMAPGKFDRDLFQFFYRMDLQTALSGRQMHFSEMPMEDPTAPSPLLEDNLNFENISDARDSLTSLKLRAYSWIHEVGFILTAPSGPLTPEQEGKHQRLSEDFHRWHAAFEVFMKKPTNNTGILDPRAPLSLFIQYHVSYFWMKKCTAKYETEYDEHIQDYKKIVECAEEIISLSKKLDTGPMQRRFVMEAPVTPSLYWTAYKCRDPVLRRRAIQAILNSPSCQGIWENRRHAASVSRIMEIEEGPVWHLPVEERFVKNEWRVVEPLQCAANFGPFDASELLLLIKPYGPDGQIVQRMEYVEWWKDSLKI